MTSDVRCGRLIHRYVYLPRLLRGLVCTAVVFGVMGAEQSLAQEAERGRLSLPRGAPFGLPGGFTGMQAFAEDGTWTAPGRRVGHVLVLLCGAGGGGAGMLDFPLSGGGGGAGASVLTTIPVEAGVTYTIAIGHGGEGGAVPGVEGAPGGPTTFQDPQGVLAQGGAGAAGVYNAERTRGVGGAGGEGQAHADGGIVRPGGDAGGPFLEAVTARTPGEIDALCTTFAPDRRGRGGEGGFYQHDRNLIIPGQPGQAGWALLIW